MDGDVRSRAEQITGHRFADESLLATALTHPSYAAEHADARDYDRLEFLGDAVVGFVVADALYRAIPGAAEGELTARKHHVVSGAALAHAAEGIGLGDLVQLGRGALAAGDRRRASVLENTMEALIGALFLDGGLAAATRFITAALGERLAATALPPGDPKSRLQEVTQSRDEGLPLYRIVDHAGPPHARVFTAEVSVAGRVLGRGDGVSKQAAEKAAAADALASFDETR